MWILLTEILLLLHLHRYPVLLRLNRSSLLLSLLVLLVVICCCHPLLNTWISFHSNSYVLVHRLSFAHSLQPVPLLPLCHSHKIKHIWRSHITFPSRSLLVVWIQFQPSLIFLDILRLSYKLCSHVEQINQSIFRHVRFLTLLNFSYLFLFLFGLLFLPHQFVEGLFKKIHKIIIIQEISTSLVFHPVTASEYL